MFWLEIAFRLASLGVINVIALADATASRGSGHGARG